MVITNSAPALKTHKLSYSTRPAIISGLLIIILGLGGFVSWAASASIASAVIATSYIVINTDRKKLQHPIGGVVKELLVRNGDVVNAGDVLIRLDETEPKAQLGIIQTNYDTTRASLARLNAERKSADRIIYPEDLHSAAVRALIMEFVQFSPTEEGGLTGADGGDPSSKERDGLVREILEGQTATFQARQLSLKGEIELTRQRIKQFKDEIDGLTTQKKAIEEQQELITEEVTVMRELVDEGLATQSRLLELEREIKRLEGDQGTVTSRLAQAEKSIGEAKIEILQKRQIYHERAVDEWRQSRTELSDLEERLSAARYELRNIELKSPVHGTIVGMQAHTIGGVIAPGETVLEIVPSGDSLVAEARIETIHIDNLAVGQEADVRLTGFNQRKATLLQGTVAYLSADALLDESTGQRFYVARIKVPEAEVAQLGGVTLQPGMPAEITIKTGERTPLDYLLQPIMDSINRSWREE